MQCVESPLPSNAEQIRRDHEISWSNFKRDLLRGDPPRPAAVSGARGRRSGISAIVRPEAEVASRLAEVAREVAVLAGREYIVLDASDIHTTLYAIEDGPADDETDIQQSAAALAGVLRTLAPNYGRLFINYRGLTAGPAGLLAQGWPSGESFQTLRRAVHRRVTGEFGTRAGLRQTAHATLVSFAGPIENPATLARFVEENRSTCYGSSGFRAVELVRYENTGRKIVLDPLAQVPLS